MENRSFDQMLGYLSLPEAAGGMGRQDVDGLTGNAVNFNKFKDVNYPLFQFGPADTVFFPDPAHGYQPVYDQIDGGKMGGFVRAYANLNETNIPAAPRIMGYHTAINVPTYDALARDFLICQRWFAAHPGPTFCNRFYTLSGRLKMPGSDGLWEFDNVKVPGFAKTIFDHLDEHGVSWNYFEDGYCFLRLFTRHTFNDTNIVDFVDPTNGFYAKARNGTLPSVSSSIRISWNCHRASTATGHPRTSKLARRWLKKWLML